MKRTISKAINKYLINNDDYRIQLIVGMRQVGKTTELKRIMSEYKNCQYFDFEDVSYASRFTPSVSRIETIIGGKNQQRILLFDEIQHVPKCGSILKIIHDHFPKTKTIATGSAAFLLLKNVGDSLIGRSVTHYMYPLTPAELLEMEDYDNLSTDEKMNYIYRPQNNIHKEIKIENLVPDICIFGSLPKLQSIYSTAYKIEYLKEYVKGLMFKDVLMIEQIKYPTEFQRLLSLVAMQVGGLVNPNELAMQLGISRQTVKYYLELFEKFQLIYAISAFTSNVRGEITKSKKIYFTDLGVRNALISQFGEFDLRQDKGALFENVVYNTIRQRISYGNLPYETYFWRTQGNKAEVDMVIKNTRNAKLTLLEMKVGKAKRGVSELLKRSVANNIEHDGVITISNLLSYL